MWFIFKLAIGIFNLHQIYSVGHNTPKLELIKHKATRISGTVYKSFLEHCLLLLAVLGVLVVEATHRLLTILSWNIRSTRQAFCPSKSCCIPENYGAWTLDIEGGADSQGEGALYGQLYKNAKTLYIMPTEIFSSMCTRCMVTCGGHL